MKPANEFTPPLLLKSRHTQSILNSLKLRRPIVLQRAKHMLRCSSSHILDCGDGVRLQGYYSRHNSGENDLCILIHGWEGSSESSYLLSAAGHLWSRGMDIFRLNMRDHGPTHHLNEGLFHSCRIREVVGAVKCIENLFPHKRLFLGGFSLGGNFAMRVALNAPNAGIQLHHVIAVCPVLYPPHTMTALETGFPIYHFYFMKKWRDSLRIKYRLFPHLTAIERVSEFKTIGRMTDFFVRNFTELPDLMTYLKGYAICDDTLAPLAVSSTIIASLDDPIIPSSDIKRLADPNCLSIRTYARGGHCGFLMDYQLNSWVDGQMACIFQG